MRRLLDNKLSGPSTQWLAAAILGAFAVAIWLGPAAKAETIVIGPRPYLSAADSPFDLSGLGTTFFLEDFEDGAVNAPGLFIPQLPDHAEVKNPGAMTDSVDGDAGPIDGSGNSGHSLESVLTLVAPSCTF